MNQEMQAGADNVATGKGAKRAWRTPTIELLFAMGKAAPTVAQGMGLEGGKAFAATEVTNPGMDPPMGGAS